MRKRTPPKPSAALTRRLALAIEDLKAAEGAIYAAADRLPERIIRDRGRALGRLIRAARAVIAARVLLEDRGEIETAGQEPLPNCRCALCEKKREAAAR